MSHEKHLYKTMRGTCERHSLLSEGDRVMVALSGGKDSYSMLVLLERLVKRLPFAVELVAVHLDQAQPGYDGTPLVEWLKTRGVRWEVLREDTYSVVTEKLRPGATYCSLCSRCGAACSTAPPSASAAPRSRSGITATTRWRPS